MASRCHFHQFSTYIRRVDARTGLDSAVNVTCRRLCLTRSKTRLACRCTRCFGASEVSDLPADCIVVPGVAQMTVLSRVCFVGVGAASLWIVGLAEAKQYVYFLGSMSFGLNTPADRFRYGISPVSMANLRGLIFGLTSSHVSASWVQMLTFALSAIAALWVMFWRRDDFRAADALLVAITTSALVSYHPVIHDLLIVLLPV